MVYKCFNCRRELDRKGLKHRVICPFCGSRIVVKARPEVIKKVKAR